MTSFNMLKGQKHQFEMFERIHIKIHIYNKIWSYFIKCICPRQIILCLNKRIIFIGVAYSSRGAYCLLQKKLGPPCKLEVIWKSNLSDNLKRVIWKSNLSDNLKRKIFLAIVESILMYGATAWTLTKFRPDSTRMLRAALSLS